MNDYETPPPVPQKTMSFYNLSFLETRFVRIPPSPPPHKTVRWSLIPKETFENMLLNNIGYRICLRPDIRPLKTCCLRNCFLLHEFHKL